MMKNILFYIFIYIFIVGCNGGNNGVGTCPDYYLDIEAPNLEMDDNGYYHMNYLPQYIQTFTTLDANTGSINEYQKVKWISNRQEFVEGYWVNCVNQNSYTDNDGVAHTVLSIWQDFVGDTITIYCGYDDNCNIQYVDSLEVIID